LYPSIVTAARFVRNGERDRERVTFSSSDKYGGEED